MLRSYRNMKIYLLILTFLSTIYCQQILERSVCEGKWTESFGFSPLVDLMKEHANKNKSNGEHPNGLTYKHEKCQKSFPYHTRDIIFPHELTAYLSDSYKFIYLYININSTRMQNNRRYLYIEDYMRASKTAKFILVLWFEKIGEYNDSNEILISYSSDSIKGSVNDIVIKDNSEQIWLKHIFTDKNRYINIEIKRKNYLNLNSAFDLSRSYIIFCAKQKSESSNTYSINKCHPTVDDNHVSCDCERNPINFYPMVIIGLFWLINCIIVIILIAFTFIKKSEDKAGIYEFVTCNKRNYKHVYVIVLKLGKASQSFDMQKTNIDIEFIGENDESLGSFTRFSSSKLTNKAMSEIIIYMYRLHPMPTIKKVKCSHSGLGSQLGDARIYLFSVTVLYLRGNTKTNQENENKESKDNKEEPQLYKINNYIVHDMRRLNAQLTNDEDDDNDTDLSNYNIENNLSKLDIIWILFNIFTFIGLMCFLLPKPIFRYGLWDTLLSVLYSSICGTIYGIILILMYKFIKKEEFSEKISNDNESGKWIYIKTGFCVIIAGISIVFGVLVLWYGQYQIPIETIYWLSATVCSCAIFVSLWLVVSHCECCSRNKSFSEDDDLFTKSFDSTASNDSSE